MPTTAPTKETETGEQLEQFQAVVAQIATLSDEVERLSANFETQIHNLSNIIGQQNLAIASLQQALPDPAPILEENVLDEHPPATREPNAQANQTPQPNQTAQGKPQTTNQGQGKEQEESDETIDLQLLAKRLTVIENDLRALPPTLERSFTATLFSSINPKAYLPYGVGAAIALSLFIAGLCVAGSYFFPAPLNAQNEGQLFQIYKKIR